jgi:hypothetical protein
MYEGSVCALACADIIVPARTINRADLMMALLANSRANTRVHP